MAEGNVVPQPDQLVISKRATSRIGYAVAIAVNVAMLIVANNILEWGWVPWLTVGLDDVLPILNVSLVVSILVTAAYLWFDPDWFKALSDLVTLGLSLAVTIQILRVFPFDFSAYEFAWATAVRWLLGFVIFAVAAGMVAEGAKLVRLARDHTDSPHGPKA